MLRGFLWYAMAPVLLVCACFGPFDPTDPPPYRSSNDPDTPVPVAAGLIAWWSCNDSSETNLVDSLGKHSGTITSCTRDSGIEGTALRFNGTSSYVSVSTSNDSAFDFSDGDFTVSAWVKPEIILFDDSSRLDIVARGEVKLSGFVLTIVAKKLAVYFGDHLEKTLDEKFSADEKVYHHVVLTRHQGEVSLYFDNTQVHQFSNTTYISFSNPLPLFIGRNSSNSNYHRYNGCIDEIKIFNIAWDASDVAREYGRFR